MMAEMDFGRAQLVQDDMAGRGEGALRFANVGRVATGTTRKGAEVDLVVVADTPYHAETKAHTGLLGKFGQLNLLSGTSVDLTFSFVDSASGEPVTLERFMFSVLDLDCSDCEVEMVTMRNFDRFFLTEKTEVLVEADADGLPVFKATTLGVYEDNPTNPKRMTAQQQNRTVTFEFSNTSSFRATFAIHMDGPSPLQERRFAEDGQAYTRVQFVQFYGHRYGPLKWVDAAPVPRLGRNFLFCGSSQLVELAPPSTWQWARASKPCQPGPALIEEELVTTVTEVVTFIEQLPPLPSVVIEADIVVVDETTSPITPRSRPRGPALIEQELVTTVTEVVSLIEKPPPLPAVVIEADIVVVDETTTPMTPRPRPRGPDDAAQSPAKTGPSVVPEERQQAQPKQEKEQSAHKKEPMKKPTHYTVVWHWGYPKNPDLPQDAYWKRGPEWFVHHPESLNEARSIYDSINERLGHHENRASRAIFSPEGEIVGTWAFDANWAENLKEYKELREKGWQPTEQRGIWH